ncbi:MAG: outer membrane protein transport protein [Pseudomonadota bacterium]
MKQALTAGVALLLTTSLAHAGGLDRSGQSITVLFEEGTYGELSFGLVTPSVDGTLASPLGDLGSGNVGVEYFQVGAAFKNDLNAQISYAVILDQPFGANVDYGDADDFYPLGNSEAEFRSTGLTVLGRYKLDDNFSVHGGIRAVTIDADSFVSVQNGNPAESFVHDASYDSDTAFAGVIGAAYERPEIALRVAVTYTSEMEFSHDTDVELTTALGATEATGETEYTIPQSINLDFQTGVAADTLVFGSIRWVEWTTTEIDSPLYPPNPIISYDDDVLTYNLGVGRRFTDEFSASIAVGYEKANGGTADELAPTDGNTSLSVGGAYTLTSGVELSGGVRYIAVGDATTGIGAEFDDNSAIAAGFKVGFNF